MAFGYTPAPSQAYTGSNKLNQNELVDYMILDEQLTPKAVKTNPANPTFKDGGLQINIAIIRRYPKGAHAPAEKCFLRDDAGNPKSPNFQVFANIVQWTPMQMLDFANLDKRTEFRQKGGGDNLTSYGDSIMPTIEDLLPSALPEHDYKNKIWADNIPTEKIGDCQTLIAAEQARRNAWSNITSFWKDLSEQDALNNLRDAIARRYFMCYINDTRDNVKYIQPVKGMLVRGIIRYDKTNKYISVEPFIWNRTLKRYDIFASCKTVLPDVPSVNLANALIELRERDREAFKVSQLAKASAKQEGDAF